MPTKKTLKTARSRPAKVAQRRAQTLNAPDVPSPHEAALEGLVNPFSDLAQGAMLPDMGNGRSLTERIAIELPLTTDANGNVILFFQPSVSYQEMTTTVSSGSPVTATCGAAFTVTPSNLTKSQENVRTVSFGARLYTTLSATEAAGRVVLAKCGPIAVNQVVNVNPNTFNAWESHPLSHGQEYALVSYTTGTEQLDWQPPQASVDTALVGLETLCIYITGAPASVTVGYVETILHAESQVSASSTLAPLTKKQPVYHPAMFTAVDEARGQHNGLFRGAKEAVLRELKGHVKRSAAKHLPKLGKALMKLALA